MGKLKILAGGKSSQAAAQARGKLFEELMADVLRQYGYRVDRIPNVNYAGMEIDIEGTAIATGIPLYAECKCYETEIDSPKLVQFFGKYMAMWRKDQRCQGLFVALPGINSHAKGFYNEHCAGAKDLTLRLLEEPDVLEAIYGTKKVCRPAVVEGKVESDTGAAGDRLLLYTENGFFWVQYVIPSGGGIPTGIMLFDAAGSQVSDKGSSEYLIQLHPELQDFELLTATESAPFPHVATAEDGEEIVQVRGSSEYFEYQFPASPEHFVGRDAILEDIDSFAAAVLNRQISSRGIIFLANSGWGKSSVVLAAVERLRRSGHLAIAIDSRSASTSQFILRAVDYAIRKFAESSQSLEIAELEGKITGFDGAVNALLAAGRAMESQARLVFIFFDQFENLFFLSDALRKIRDMLLKVCDSQTNVVFGFSWKTDLFGLTTEFPYKLREEIETCSRKIILETFSESEAAALLERLGPLRKDLQFFLVEFSQGYPWLLKRLCAHVKIQRENGVLQQDIADGLLNVEQLFQEDLRGLTTEEEDTLKRIARIAPITISELGEEYRPDIVQTLVNRRLLVRVANKYDIYWDIFRDYLNTSRLPTQENYILHMQVGSVLRAARMLYEANGAVSRAQFRQQASLSEKYFYNLARDLKLLGIAATEGSEISLNLDLRSKFVDPEAGARPHIRERLLRNRVVQRIMKGLEAENNLTTDQLAGLLKSSCPYISATDKTWRHYARVFATWMDFADLAILHGKKGVLTKYIPGLEVRERQNIRWKRPVRGLSFPNIQYRPIERVAELLVQASKSGRPDWSQFKRTTLEKALSALQQLGFIDASSKSIRLQTRIINFVSNPDKRAPIFGQAALQLKSFKIFIETLEKWTSESSDLASLIPEVKKNLGVEWSDSTAIVCVKIMLNWARHSNLAPDRFMRGRRGNTDI
jgi:hypothetical protein